MLSPFKVESTIPLLDSFNQSFNTFRDNVVSGMNFLRRRFSSGDLQGELNDENSSILTFKKGPSPSAPSSPSKSSHIPSGTFRGVVNQAVNKPSYNKDRCKTLLIIDDPHTDWYVYRIELSN